MPPAIPVGTRIYIHDNPSSPPIYGHISAFEQMANGTQMAKVDLDTGRSVTVPMTLISAAP